MKETKILKKNASKLSRTTREDELRLRKLKAETELAERNLRESKKRWKHCESCGGHGVFKRSLGRTGSYREGWTYDQCSSCSGRGGRWIYEE